MRVLIILYLCSFTSLANWHDRKLEGWLNFEEFAKQEEKKKQQQEEKNPVLTREEKLLQDLEDYKAKFERQKKIALSSLEPDDMKSYLEMKIDMLNRSRRFMEIGQRLLYLNPELDLTTQSPVNQIGLSHEKTIKQREVEQLLRGISQKWGFFFFYSSDCSGTVAV